MLRAAILPLLLLELLAGRCQGFLAVPFLGQQGTSLCVRRGIQCRPGLTKVWTRRGPDMPAEWWDEPDNIVEELQYFLTARDEEEARVLSSKKNPLRQYLGLSDEQEKRIRQREAPVDRELYGELRRYGFEYLVVPIMKLGGFRAFAKRLREEDEEAQDQAIRSGQDGGLALGRALEEKLERLSDEISATGGVGTSSDSPAKDGGSVAGGGSPAEVEGAEWVQAKTPSSSSSGKSPAERAAWSLALSLTQPQKAYLSVLALAVALAFGRASGGAVEAGVVGPEVVDWSRLVAQAALVANVLSVPAVGVAVRGSGREEALGWGPYGAWLAKTALCGPMALLQARTALTKPPQQPSASEQGP